MNGEDVADVRQRIRDVDARILDLVAERMRLARVVGAIKSERGVPIRDYVVEAEVIAGARDAAARRGFAPELAEDVVKRLILESLRVQEADRREVAREGPGTGGRALVIGGRGLMGRWFVEFLDSKGFSVSVADVSGPLEGYPFVEDWRADLDVFDAICVAVPPSRVGDVLDGFKDARDVLVFDIASLKSPFIKDLESLAARGVHVTSIHPMWGPRTELLARKNLVVCDCGNAEATRAARALFEDTAANVVEVPVGAHDELMAFTLGLPHAVNLAFARALGGSPHAFEDLKHLGGPTFTKQVRIAHEVANENKDLYFEIQSLNAHSPVVYRRIKEAFEELERTTGTREAFIAYMKECQRYLGEGV